MHGKQAAAINTISSGSTTVAADHESDAEIIPVPSSIDLSPPEDSDVPTPPLTKTQVRNLRKRVARSKAKVDGDEAFVEGIVESAVASRAGLGKVIKTGASLKTTNK